MQEELQRLRAEEHAIERRERERIARDLHDGVQQYLAAVQMSVQQAHAQNIPPYVAELLEHSLLASTQALSELSHVVNNLRPAAIHEVGLVAALEQMAQRLMALTDLQIEIEWVGSEAAFKELPEPISECAFRVAQECLNNVRKHAKASFVLMQLDASDTWDLSLQITDDGVGMLPTASQKASSFGLHSMRQRVVALGGVLEVLPGRLDGESCGTSVQVRLPLSPADSGIGTWN